MRRLPKAFFQDGEVIIVNNAPQELEHLEKITGDFGAIRVVDMGENTGFARACNRGAQVARGEIVFFLNPDAYFVSGVWEKWLETFHGVERVILAPRLRQGEREEPWSHGWVLSPLRLIAQNLWPFSWIWSNLRVSAPGWVSGAALAIRKQDFDHLGGFDQGYFLYYEDMDLCRRARRNGMRIVHDRTVTFEHQGGGSHAGDGMGQKKAYYASQERYLRTYYPQTWIPFFRALRWFRSFLSHT